MNSSIDSNSNLSRQSSSRKVILNPNKIRFVDETKKLLGPQINLKMKNIGQEKSDN
jgi:hypothetical protein